MYSHLVYGPAGISFVMENWYSRLASIPTIDLQTFFDSWTFVSPIFVYHVKIIEDPSQPIPNVIIRLYPSHKTERKLHLLTNEGTFLPSWEECSPTSSSLLVLVVKVDHFLHSLKCMFDIFVIVPKEEVAKRLHAFSFPIILERRVTFFGIFWNLLEPKLLQSFFVFHSTVFQLHKVIVLNRRNVVFLQLPPKAVDLWQLEYVKLLITVEPIIEEETFLFTRSIGF